MWAPKIWVVVLLGALGFSRGIAAQSVQVAVAANVMPVMAELARVYEDETGNHLLLITGSTGKLASQIENGAPFEVLLAADEATPLKLEAEGLAVPNTRFTYGIGRLVLWSPRAGLVDPEGKILAKGAFAHLSVANPRLAGYGAAALEVIQALGLESLLNPKQVQGESIAQAYQFVVSGNAELGFVALSQVFREGQAPEGSLWMVPDSLYSPLRQDAVLLQPGAENPAARAFLNYLKSAHARSVLSSFGYR